MVKPVTDLEPGFKMTELGPLPEEWEVVSLRDVSLKTKQINPKKNPEREFQYVDVSSISRVSLSINDTKEYEGKEAPSRARKLIKANDVIFATVRPYLKRVALIPSQLDGQICSTAFCVIRNNSKYSDANYLFFSISNDKFVDRVTEHQRGSSYPAVSDNDVLNEQIPLPPLPEQRAIAHVLRTVQRARETTEAVIEATKQLKRSLMRHLFTYGPVPVDQAEQVKLKDTEIGPMPEEWEVVKLGEISEAKVSTTHPSKLPKETESNNLVSVLYLKVSDLNAPANTKVVRSAANTYQVSNQKLKNLSYIPAKSIVMPKRGAAIFTNKKRIVGAPSLLDPNLIAVVPNKRVDSNYLFNWFEQFDLGSICETATLPQLNKKDVEPVLFPLPPLSEQRKIAEILTTVDCKIETEQARKAALDQLFKTLLANLMTGKIRVKVKK